MNWIFSDNINTDLITPGRYNITTNPKELARIAFIEYRPEFAKKVRRGDFLIAGNNFGCGSSRETAATALKFCGLRAIFAKSFARIFYRNCLNIGLLAIITDTGGIDKNDILSLDIKKNTLTNKTKKTKKRIDVPRMMLLLHEHGGIIPYIRAHGLNSLKKLISIA